MTSHNDPRTWCHQGQVRFVLKMPNKPMYYYYTTYTYAFITFQRFSRAGPRGRGREWATLRVHPLYWLISNNWLEKVPVVSVPHTSSNRLLLSNQDKGCTPSVAHSLPLPLGPALLNLSIAWWSSHLYWKSLTGIGRQWVRNMWCDQAKSVGSQKYWF